jgi:hypothetical protein
MNEYKPLYRRNNLGRPCFWEARVSGSPTQNIIIVSHGIVGKAIQVEEIHVARNPKDEVESRYKQKRKQGYKFLDEIKDDNWSTPVKEDALLTYLETYLPYDRTTADGTLLPMLAKTFDNTNNKIFNKTPVRIGQYKINGLRCIISAKRNNTDMFKPIGLKFQSREGTYWNSLSNLEDYLLTVIPNKFLNKMIDEDWELDGELYLPGYTVNEINHFIKDPKCKENKFIQYWCFDAIIDDTPQYRRLDILGQVFENRTYEFTSLNNHLNNKERFIYINNYTIENEDEAVEHRNLFINLGFEGLILRDPDKEYQIGKRNSSMIKFKDVMEGSFKIIDIYPEGVSRNIPLFLCKNDINNETFEVHINGSLKDQEKYLYSKDKFIGKTLYITFGERSGVSRVPFHVKTVRLE